MNPRIRDEADAVLKSLSPSDASELLRHSIFQYVSDVLRKCFNNNVSSTHLWLPADCTLVRLSMGIRVAILQQLIICRFGSVPLKTYLPDGDLDICIFTREAYAALQRPSRAARAAADCRNAESPWPIRVKKILLEEARQPNPKFEVREVVSINAEIKIVKCLIDSIQVRAARRVGDCPCCATNRTRQVDISANQVGGLLTLHMLDRCERGFRWNHPRVKTKQPAHASARTAPRREGGIGLHREYGRQWLPPCARQAKRHVSRNRQRTL